MGAYVVSIWMLGLVVREVPISVAYAVWSGLGTAAIATIGVLLLGDEVDALKVTALAMIIVGVVLLNLHHAH
jgi:multidrug transporter EmrE-like cation transporter